MVTKLPLIVSEIPHIPEVPVSGVVVVFIGVVTEVVGFVVPAVNRRNKRLLEHAMMRQCYDALNRGIPIIPFT